MLYYIHIILYGGVVGSTIASGGDGLVPHLQQALIFRVSMLSPCLLYLHLYLSKDFSSGTSRIARGANCSTSAAVSERATRLRARKGSRITGRTKTWQLIVNLQAAKLLYNVIEETDIRSLFF